MNLFLCTPIRCSFMLLITVLLVSGCSSSTDSNSPADMSGTDGDVVTAADGTTGNTTTANLDESTDSTGESTTGPSDSEDSSTARVEFMITVPVYVSNALQVRLVWGDVDTTLMWKNDEHWIATVDLPVNTTNQLVVTFSDDNGAVTLGSYETSFKTGTNPSESFQVAADEFDTDQFDSDGDGQSNLSESIAGTNPLGSNALVAVQPVLEFVADKTFRISWQSSTSVQFYRVFENPDGITGFTDISGELDATTTRFDHRVALFARVNAQYLVQSCSDRGCVDSDVMMVTGTLTNAIGYIKASNAGRSDLFGDSVSLSADGNTLAVGAIWEDSDATGINGDGNDNSSDYSGAVYVFVRSGGLWQQQAYLKASNTDAMDSFGASLSLSANGNALAVGAREDSGATGINGDQDDNSANSAGAVYVFVRSGEHWQQQAYLKASNTDTFDEFGFSLSLSADGNTLAVGAYGESSGAIGINDDGSDNSADDAGAVYVFVRSDRVWLQQAYLKASNTDAGDEFGKSLSLSGDGNTLAVGARSEDSTAIGINGDQSDNSGFRTGAAYVFVRSGGLWHQQVYLKASNTGGGDDFGSTLSLSADGETLAVGAHNEDSSATGINGDQSDNEASASGAVYVFVRSGGLWQQQAYLKASNTDAGDGFGLSLSLSADGGTLVVGAWFEDGGATGVNGDQGNSILAAGAAYVLVRSGELWQQQAYLKASNTGQYPDHINTFGKSLSLSAEGGTLAVSAVENTGDISINSDLNNDQSDNSNGGTGAVYLF